MGGFISSGRIRVAAPPSPPELRTGWGMDGAVELQPSHFGAYSGMGLCYIAINDLPKALKCLRKALALNPRLDQIRSYLVKLEAMVDADEEM